MTLFHDPVWPDLSGRISNGRHVLPVRVYFEDTDFSGAAYHASYLRWCERGRSDFLRLLGIEHHALAAGKFTGEPAAFAVRRIAADFLKPARIDDLVEIETEASEINKASITLSQEIRRGGTAIFRLTAQCVIVNFAGKLLRMPPSLMQLFPPSA